MRSAPCPDVGDRGSGSVLLLAVVVLLGALAMTLAGVVQVQTARSAARAAADLAALAAAASLALPIGVDLAEGAVRPAAQACDRAAEVARRNGGLLVACHEDGGGVVRVEVVRETPWGAAGATAVAGPVEAR